MSFGTEIARELRARAAAGEPADAVLRRAVQALKDAQPKYDWVGIYLLEGEELILHEYIGAPTEHTRIPVGVGVCGTAVARGEDLNVPDVTALDNYLACSVGTQSEIVVLIVRGDRILGQIDIDSDAKGAFGDEDLRELRAVADALADALEARRA
ncbi:MAG: GAF domain-containing protein [Gemmatimonadota bacterium]